MTSDRTPQVGDDLLVSDGFGAWVPGVCDACDAGRGFMNVSVPSVHLLLTLGLDGYEEAWKWPDAPA